MVVVQNEVAPETLVADGRSLDDLNADYHNNNEKNDLSEDDIRFLEKGPNSPSFVIHNVSIRINVCQDLRPTQVPTEIGQRAII